MDRFPFELLYQEHRRISAEAQREGIPLRLLGALAFHLRCPQYASLRTELGRELSDLDYIALSRQWNAVINMLTALGYEFDERRAMLHGHDRVLFFHPTGLRVDIFFDQLDMCHRIDLRDRLTVDEETISLADLLLEKMQIVRLTEKDIIDTITLLLEHPLAATDQGINAEYIARRLAGDWGFYYTLTTNLRRISDEFVELYHQLDSRARQKVQEQIGQLLDRIEAEPKTLKWKARARIGPSVQWYKDVGELVR
ncbi:MAG: hypothetical protein ACUVWZ_08395 [Anaerolineae bacterium]